MTNKPNTIGTTEGKLADGSVVIYSDTDPSHIKQGRFQKILKEAVEFQTTAEDGLVLGVNLATGALRVGEQVLVPQTLGENVRLIYYKHMYMSVDGPRRPTCEYYVVGYQQTLDGRNNKIGVKVYPKEKRWEITQDI